MTDANEPLILGGELAAAQAREDAHVPPGPSPLAGVAYPGAATELWRWVESPQDQQVAAFVAEYAMAKDHADLRARLTMDDFYTLITFARRNTLAALRTRNPAHVVAAFDALSAVELERIDWRDGSWAAAIVTYAGQQLGMDLEAAVAGPVSRAGQDTAELLAETVAEEVDLSGDWGYVEVETADGVVLLATEDEPYAPEADLASMGMALARALEADRYDVDGVTLAGELYPTWVGDQEHLVTNLLGVVSVHGNLRGSVHDTLLAFVGEAPSPDQAHAIAEAAQTSNEVALTAASGKVFTVLIARSVVYGQKGQETSLTRFTPTLKNLWASRPGDMDSSTPTTGGG